MIVIVVVKIMSRYASVWSVDSGYELRVAGCELEERGRVEIQSAKRVARGGAFEIWI